MKRLLIVDVACIASNASMLSEKTLDALEGLQVRVINRS